MFTDDNLLAGNEFYSNCGIAINSYGSRNVFTQQRDPQQRHRRRPVDGDQHRLELVSPLTSADNLFTTT